MKIKLYILFLFTFNLLIGQDRNKNFIQEWKSYLADNSTFEYLKLNSDGTGFKGFGKTIKSKDTIFINHFSSLKITNWNTKNGVLNIYSEHSLTYNPSIKYQIINNNEAELKITGDHLKLNIYPSNLNKTTFNRTVNYKNAKHLLGEQGVKKSPCIYKSKIFTFKHVDSLYIKASYKGFKDLIPHIVSCHPDYEYSKSYKDLPYQLKLPNNLNKWSFGFGNRLFNISLDSYDETETSIVIYYDFKNENKEFFFSQIEKGKEEKKTINLNNKEIFLFKNWQNKFSGKVFYSNNIYVAYYTKDKRLEELLRNCITSFEYK